MRSASASYARYAAFAVAFAAVAALDRLTKVYCEARLSDGSRLTLLPGLIDLKLVHNSGAAFGIGQGRAWFFVAAAVVIIGICVAYLVRGKPSLPLATVLGAVAGGGAGNLYDRVATGQVTDFLMTTFIDFPVFNVADIAIVVGFAIAVVILWREPVDPDDRTDEEGGAS